jgi:aspartate racemase
MSRRLERAGAEALAMPCNTAHFYAPAIKAAVGISLIDMVALSVEHAAGLAPLGGTVGVLASPAVRLTGLFDRALADVGLTAIYGAEDDALLSIIRRIKADGPVDDARMALAKVSRGLLDRGAQVQLVACTEFSLIADAVDAGAVSFDTLDRLVGGIIAFATAGDAGQQRAGLKPPTTGATAPQYLPNKETTP